MNNNVVESYREIVVAQPVIHITNYALYVFHPKNQVVWARKGSLAQRRKLSSFSCLDHGEMVSMAYTKIYLSSIV